MWRGMNMPKYTFIYAKPRTRLLTKLATRVVGWKGVAGQGYCDGLRRIGRFGCGAVYHHERDSIRVVFPWFFKLPMGGINLDSVANGSHRVANTPLRPKCGWLRHTPSYGST